MECSTGVGYVLLTWLLWQPLLRDTIAFDDLQFATPVSEGLGVEYYDSGDQRFGIFTEKVSWTEAKKLCHSRGGSLVEYTKEGVSAFIGRALAESAVCFSALWIGGEFTPSESNGVDGMWKWSQSQELIDTNVDNVLQFPMTSAPYWVDKPNLQSRKPMCLATDRNLHHNALIVSVPCDRKRPSICSLPKADVPPTVLEITAPVKVGGKTLHLFNRLVTWTEALNQCRAMGMNLAKVTTAEEFRTIMNRMRRVRPIMENAWIGGTFENGQWIWIEDSEAINVDQAKADSEHPFVWYRKNLIINDGCLLADRHLCEHFVYVEAKCDRRRNFICEKVQEQKTNSQLPPLVQIPGTDYYISTFEETWHKAQAFCKMCLDTDLIRIETTKEGLAAQLPVLYTAMALTLRVEIQHLWLGGYLFGHKFKWASGDLEIEPDDGNTLTEGLFEGLQEGGEKGRLVYCDANFERFPDLVQYKCLNMDRENQKYFSLYGIMCDHKQHFMCRGVGALLDWSCVGVSLTSFTEATTTPASEPAPTTAPTTITAAPETTTTTTSEPEPATAPTTITAAPETTTTTTSEPEPATAPTTITAAPETTTTTTSEPEPTTAPTTITAAPETTTTTTSEPEPATEPMTGLSSTGSNDTEYWLGKELFDWTTSQDACKVCAHGSLLSLNGSQATIEQRLRVILDALYENQSDKVEDVWLGGYYFNDKYKWTNTSTVEPMDDDSLFSAESFKGLVAQHVMGKVEFHEREPGGDNDCLLVRYDIATPAYVMTSAPCKEKHRFICQTIVFRRDDYCELRLPRPLSPDFYPD